MAGEMNAARDRDGHHDEPATEAPISARIAHVALWTRDVERLERLRAFYERHFGARAGAAYHSTRQPGFVSYFLELAGGAQLELMTLPADASIPDVEPSNAATPRPGYAHISLSLGSTAAVDVMTARLASDGVSVRSAPRWTGDGFYEAVVADPDGNLVELTA
jgi:lactoylglutathione lyase